MKSSRTFIWISSCRGKTSYSDSQPPTLGRDQTSVKLQPETWSQGSTGTDVFNSSSTFSGEHSYNRADTITVQCGTLLSMSNFSTYYPPTSKIMDSAEPLFVPVSLCPLHTWQWRVSPPLAVGSAWPGVTTRPRVMNNNSPNHRNLETIYTEIYCFNQLNTCFPFQSL